MNEDQIREIIQSEIYRFAGILLNLVANLAKRKDGALSQADFYYALEAARDRLIRD